MGTGYNFHFSTRILLVIIFTNLSSRAAFTTGRLHELLSFQYDPNWVAHWFDSCMHYHALCSATQLWRMSPSRTQHHLPSRHSLRIHILRQHMIFILGVWRRFVIMIPDLSVIYIGPEPLFLLFEDSSPAIAEARIGRGREDSVVG